MQVETETTGFGELMKLLNRLTFLPVVKVLTHREDLESFVIKGASPVVVFSRDLDFGDQVAEWGSIEEIRKYANPQFRYYSGFAKGDELDVYFSKRSRGGVPLPFPFLFRHYIRTPVVGDVILGEVQDGEKSKVFSWWHISSIQEQRFQEMMLGQKEF